MSAPATSVAGAVPSSPEAGHAGMRESLAHTDIRLQARGLVRVLAGELAKRRRYLATAVDGELHPQNVGVSLRCSRRDPESVGALDIRVSLREQVHDLTLPNGKSCLAIESQHGPHIRACSEAALLAIGRISASTPFGLKWAPRMHLDIVPEPSSDERDAIIAALEKARAEADSRDDWWRAGVIENLEEGAGESLSPADE